MGLLVLIVLNWLLFWTNTEAFGPLCDSFCWATNRLEHKLELYSNLKIKWKLKIWGILGKWLFGTNFDNFGPLCSALGATRAVILAWPIYSNTNLNCTQIRKKYNKEVFVIFIEIFIEIDFLDKFWWFWTTVQCTGCNLCSDFVLTNIFQHKLESFSNKKKKERKFRKFW